MQMCLISIYQTIYNNVYTSAILSEKDISCKGLARSFNLLKTCSALRDFMTKKFLYKSVETSSLQVFTQ